MKQASAGSAHFQKAGTGTQAQSSPNLGVVYSADADEKRGLVASIRSVLRNTKVSFNVYLFILHDEEHEFANLTHVDGKQIIKKYFSWSDVNPYVNKVLNDKHAASRGLDDPHNYARYIMAEKIPEADGLVWMDADVVTSTDIMKDMKAFLQSGKVAGAFERSAFIAGQNNIPAKIHSATKLPIQGKPYFNAGFMYLSPAKYREGNFTGKSKEIIAANNVHKWWTSLGSQPPLNLLMGGSQLFGIKGFSYILMLGMKHNVGTDKEGVYHWNGPHKPWLKNG